MSAHKADPGVSLRDATEQKRLDAKLQAEVQRFGLPSTEDDIELEAAKKERGKNTRWRSSPILSRASLVRRTRDLVHFVPGQVWGLVSLVTSTWDLKGRAFV